MDDAIARVNSYIAAYQEAWEELYERVSDGGDFETWAEAMDRIGEAHCLEGGNEMDRYSIGAPPSHDPAVEEVLDRWLEDDIVIVITQCGDFRYFEYELELDDDEWRIASIRQTATDPREPLMSGDALEGMLAAARDDAPFQPLAPNEDPSNALFEHGRPIETSHDAGELQIRRIGELNVVSGVLVVQDFGYDAYNLAPLERRVPPGRYPVEVSSVFGRNAAMRVCFGDPDDVVAWHPANVPGSGHVAGVDAGNLSVFDLASFGALTVQQKERVYEDAVVNPSSHPAAQMVTLVYENDGTVASSGWGDGSYPVHWGVDESGAPVVLLLDFLVACSWPTEDVEVEVTADAIGAEIEHPVFAEHDLAIRLERDAEGTWLALSGRRPSALIVVDDEGEELCDVMRQSSKWAGGQASYLIPPTVVDALPWKLRVAVSKGYRNR